MDRCLLPVPRSRARSLAFLAGTAVPLLGVAHAQTLNWNNAAGGSASTAANWNPAQVPTAANPLAFALNAAYAVTFNATTPQSSSMAFTRGTVTLTMNSPHSTGSVSLGNGNATNGTATLTTGFLTASSVFIGPTFGAAGTLNLNDDDAILDCGSLSVAADTNLVCNMNVTGSGTVRPSSVVIGGANPLGRGNVLVSGQTQVFPPKRSTLESSGSITVGDTGIGALTVADGGLVSCTGGVTIARDFTTPGSFFSDGTVTVGGLGLILPASLEVGTTLRIGRGTLTSSDTGNGRMTINDDGIVTVGGATQVGGSGLGSGSLTVNAGGTFISHGLSFGTSGDFVHNGGDVRVSDGAFVHDEPTLVINGSSDQARLILDNISNTPSFSSTTSLQDPGIIVGVTGSGRLDLINGSFVATSLGNLVVAAAAGSTGVVDISGGSSLSLQNAALLGSAGTAFLTLSSGSHMSTSVMMLADNAGSFTGVVTGAGTVCNTGLLFIAGDGNSEGGTATLTVSDGAVLNAAGSNPNGDSVILWPNGGSLTIDNAAVNASADFEVRGQFSLVNGVVSAARFFYTVPFTASGAIDAPIVGTPTITAGGDLVLGDGTAGAFNLSPLSVGAFRVELHDSATAVLANTTLNGGTLFATNNFSLPGGRTLSGTGTVTGPAGSTFTNSGAITATGTNGLTFGTFIVGAGQGIGGTRFVFADGGGFNGAAAINSKIVGQAGSRIRIESGASSLGDGSTAGFTTDGVLEVRSPLTINDSNGIGLGSRTTLINSAITCATDINLGTLPTLDLLEGAGVINGNVNNAGVIAPGLAGDPAAQLTIRGTLSMRSGALRGALDFEIAGLGPDDADRIFADAAILDGAFTLSLINGFAPTPGYSRLVLNSGAPIVGQFQSVSLPRHFSIQYTNNNVQILFCPGDFNGNGFVNSQDFFDFLGFFFANSPSADFNGDTTVNSQDFFDFLTAFFTGC